jgi:transcriptional regulator with XRE-family HTH domain
MNPENTMDRPLKDIITSTLDRQNISIRELARRANLAHPTISNIINGAAPTYEVCAKLAPVLNLPLEIVLRSAGLLPATEKLTPDQQHMLYLYNSLGTDQRKYVLKFMQALKDEK